MTSTISDITLGNTSTNHSKMDHYAMKALIAKDMIEHFHKYLNELPEEFKKIIESKRWWGLSE
ncbi:hypothetical protein [Oceanobacillus neutriphilus]|uniref:Uncharacterized protein n=1 Tax=Oceanobacillus neutriphilus TaxID=531815 RepID=A0ABQ2NXX6_9BACI|nr:hypothetical protein [Oceanobacillus neutriphilus]GGP13271.1 hypothetical protein GCM10011346_32730 [Oceanobacillus neutriphilus]